MVEVAGKKIRGRKYPWGVVEVENPEHCDFVKLRTMLITHMQDLQEVTNDVHYENFRSQKLLQKLGNGHNGNGAIGEGGVEATPARVAIAGRNGSSGGLDNKDDILREKEAELKRMQEMVAQMQQQIKMQSQTSLASAVSSNY